MPEPTSFRDVILLWGSADLMADANGFSVPATRKWFTRDRIPDEYWLPIIESPVGKANGVTSDLLVRLAAKGNTTAPANEAVA